VSALSAEPSGDAAALIAAAESAPVTVELIAALVAVDPAGLDASGRVGLAVVWARVENWAAARKTDAVAVVAGPPPCSDDDPAAFAWAEVGAALRLGDGESARLVHVARELRDLPATREAMARGGLSWKKAATLAETTQTLTGEQRSEVEAAVLGKAAERTPAQHARAVRRAVDAVDPAGLTDRRHQALADVSLARQHLGDGMGELLATMPAEQLDLVWTAADAWARRAKAAGDPRRLDQLRVAALVDWAHRFLTDGDPPTRHGAPVTVEVTIDLPALLDLTDTPGELLDTGAAIPAQAVRDLLEDGAKIRWLLTDPATGRLLGMSCDTYRPSASLATFLGLRDVTPTTPTAGVGRANTGDIDHLTPYHRGGRTDTDNLHTPSRRWHRAKTLAGWTVTRNNTGSWTWTSPTGRHHTVEPHDYRRGP
jgi:hypothetical protein